MELHIYTTFKGYKTPLKIKHAVCEAEEKPKTYAIKKYANHFYRRALSKDEIGKVLGSYSEQVVLLERDDELAKSLLLEKYRLMLESKEKEVEGLRTEINCIKDCEIGEE